MHPCKGANLLYCQFESVCTVAKDNDGVEESERVEKGIKQTKIHVIK